MKKDGIMYGRYAINQKKSKVHKICNFQFNFTNNEQKSFIKEKNYKIGITVINENCISDNNSDKISKKWFLTNEIITKEIKEDLINKMNTLVIKFQVIYNCELDVSIFINGEEVKKLKKMTINFIYLFYPFFEVIDFENFSDFKFKFKYE